jgi:hypothetical protein
MGGVGALTLGLGIGQASVASAASVRSRALRPGHVSISGLKPSAVGGLQVVASGLDNPRHLTVGPDGNLYVAEAGHGGDTTTGSCYATTDPESGQPVVNCAGPTGAIAKVTPAGVKSIALGGLPSVADPQGPEGASGPAAVTFGADGKMRVVVQDTDVAPYLADPTHSIPAQPGHDGTNPYSGGTNNLLGKLVTAAVGSASGTWTSTDIAAFEGANNPDGVTTDPVTNPGMENPWDSDPYAVTPYHGGYAVVDAAANDLLWVDPLGGIHVLAVFPSQPELTPPGFLGPDPVLVPAQAVPTSVVVGPDGALYVGQLVGVPSLPGTAHVFRVANSVSAGGVATQVTPTVFADGFSSISDLAFDAQGRLLVLEIDVNGLLDQSNPPASGALIRIENGGSKTTLASQGLLQPTGLAVAGNTIYISNLGVLPAQGDPSGLSGQVVKVTEAPGGYRLAASDGGVFTFGDNGFFGSTGGIKLNKPVVGTTATSDDKGYWLVASDGGVFTFGDAGFFGSTGNVKLNKPVVGIASTPDNKGYWLVASDGGVFTFGDAGFYGSTGDVKLNKPIVGIASTPSGKGYWLVASDGGVFTFGDAAFFGSTGNVKLNKPVVGIAAGPDGHGYWLVASDGGVFSFEDPFLGGAGFFGSTGNVKLNKPIVGIRSSLSGKGYWLVASDGGIFNFGDAAFHGSTGGISLVAPIVGIN